MSCPYRMMLIHPNAIAAALTILLTEPAHMAVRRTSIHELAAHAIIWGVCTRAWARAHKCCCVIAETQTRCSSRDETFVPRQTRPRLEFFRPVCLRRPRAVQTRAKTARATQHALSSTLCDRCDTSTHQALKEGSPPRASATAHLREGHGSPLWIIAKLSEHVGPRSARTICFDP